MQYQGLTRTVRRSSQSGFVRIMYVYLSHVFPCFHFLHLLLRSQKKSKDRRAPYTTLRETC